MAKGGGSRGSGRKRDASAARPSTSRGAQPKGKPQPRRTPRPSPAPSPEPAQRPPAETFRLGAVPGATPGKWIDVWKERMPRTSLELVPLAVADEREALIEGVVDAAIVRLPLDPDALHVIPLYDEVPVVVASVDSHLTAADDLELADIAGEVVIVPGDDVLGLRVPGAVAPAFAPPADTAEAIATVAAGVGVVVVPMSLARLHQRKDVAYRPLRDGPVSSVSLAWVAERTTPEVEAFVGIVRGRTANSSRS